MSVEKLLKNVELLARRNSLSKPFIVGGVPREMIIGSLGKKADIKDIDITTGNKDSMALAQVVGKSFQDSNFRIYDDGHSSVDILGVHIDFSSNFVAPGVKEYLVKNGIKDLTPMKLELYSRDFTINTMLETLNFEEIYDITGEAIDDINAGIIKCPIDPEITISVDPRRILRAIKFAIKYGFKIEDNLKNAMLNNRKKILELPVKFVQDKISEIAQISDKGTDMMIEYKLLSLVPLTKTVYDILIQKRQLVRAL